MSIPFLHRASRALLVAVVTLTGLHVQATTANPDWENGRTLYGTSNALPDGICVHCHNADVTQTLNGYPATNVSGTSASYLQGRFDATPRMGTPYTDRLSSLAMPSGADGVADIAAYIANPNFPKAVLSGPSISSGSVGVSLPLPIGFTVTNSGFGPLTITKAYVVDSIGNLDSTNFSVNLGSCARVPNTSGNNTCSIVVTFKTLLVQSFTGYKLQLDHTALTGHSTANLPSPLVGLAPLAVSTTALTFNATAPTQSLTITDNVGDAVKICITAGASSLLSDPAAFTLPGHALDSSGCYAVGTAIPSTLPRALGGAPYVQFSQVTGEHDATLVISRIGGSAPGVTLFRVPLVGNPGPVAKVDTGDLFDVPLFDPRINADNDNVLVRSIKVFSVGANALDFTGGHATFVIAGDYSSDYLPLPPPGPGDCRSKAGLLKYTGEPADSCTLTVQFNPSGAGLRHATLTIHVDGTPTDNFVELNGTGFLDPQLVVRQGMKIASGTQLEFGTQTKGGLYQAQTIALSNIGSTGNLDVTLPAPGTVSGFMFVPSAGCSSLPPPPPFSIAPATPCTVDIKFDPAAAQPYTTSFVIQSRPAGASGAFTQFVVQLHGQGSDGAVPTLMWTDNKFAPISQLGFSPSPTSVGSSTTALVPIRLFNNGSGGGVELKLANVVGLDASNFVLDTSDCSVNGALKTLYQGDSCAVGVTFTPGTPGAKMASIQLTATFPFIPNGATQSQPALVVPPLLVVSGTAMGFASAATLETSSLALTFGATTVGAASLPQELVLSNPSGRILRVLSLDVAAPFAVRGTTCASAPFDLAPGAACSVNVMVAPQAEGQLSGTLHVTNDGMPPTVDVALSVNAAPKADVSSGGGCTITRGDSRFTDPTLWLLVLLAIGVLCKRRKKPKQ